MIRLSAEAFEHLVDEALASLPDWVEAKMDNVAILVAPWPSRGQIESVQRQRGRSGLLLGLYEGVPLTRRGRGYHLTPPDRITLFQRALEMQANDPQQLVAAIQRTVIHEIGHHFGMSEEQLRELGY
ncbi:MAG: metallopeptidase family protein [Anaerolineae bacterium]|nr:metallopeptidase family protein [Anaerolineae bacterium]